LETIDWLFPRAAIPHVRINIARITVVIVSANIARITVQNAKKKMTKTTNADAEIDIP
jgi:hypothetical protein